MPHGLSPAQTQKVFDDYVFTFIEGDIKREIWLAKKAEHDKVAGVYPGTYPGGGNILAALGLACYTEFLGSFMPNTHSSRKRFDAFLAEMGDCYKAFMRVQKKPNVFDLFRNGLAHEYAVKRDCDIYMVGSGAPCGLGVQSNGRYYFVVERYFEDFQRAARRLYKSLTGVEPPPL
jgi:hypothetical protein